jgi:GMP synthase-like glutamine amidotransferase
MHQDIVFSLPPGVVSLGSSPRCEVQGMYAAGRFITVQGHPEFNGEIITEIVKVRSTGGIFTEEMAKDADDRAFNEQDGIAIGAVFLKFLLEE